MWNFGKAKLPVALWLVLAAGFSLRLLLALTDLPTLITLNLPDDAFYYFKIAENIARGYGSTFDGVHLTNGYHPLWAGLLIPLFKVLPGKPDIVVHLALVLQACLDVGTGFLVYLIAKAILANGRWAVLASALYLFNPNALFYQIDGMETALATLMATAVLYLYLRLQGGTRAGWADRVKFAVACGLLLLARTDYIFLCVLLFGVLAAREWKERRALHRTITMGIIVTSCLTPWLVWNYLHFHQFVQVSGLARPWVIRQNLQESALSAGLAQLRYELTYEWPSQSCLYAGYYVLIALGGFLLIWRKNDPSRGKQGHDVLVWGWTALSAIMLFHCFVRLYPRPWYSALFLVLNALTITWAGKQIWALPRARRGVVMAMGVIFLAYGMTAWHTSWQKKYPWQGEFARAAEWINDHTNDDARIGAFNAGIMGFFAHRMVINLDGAVNNSAYEALRADGLHRYAVTNSIDFVADFRHSAEFEHRKFWNGGQEPIGLARVKCFPTYPIYWERSVMAIYRVTDSSAQGTLRERLSSVLLDCKDPD